MSNIAQRFHISKSLLTERRIILESQTVTYLFREKVQPKANRNHIEVRTSFKGLEKP